MPRIRTLKPELATDVKLARVSRDARFTFVLLITQADDEGLIAGAHRQLLGALYPHDEDVTAASLLGWVEELVDVGALRWRSTRDGAPVLELVNWSRHQRVDNKSRSQLAIDLVPPEDTPPDISAYSRNLAEVRGEPRRVAEVRGLDLGPRTRDLGPSPRRVERAKGARSTFDLGPYLDAHREVFPDSDPPAGRYGAVFKRLEKKHGAAEVLRRWRICLATKGDFATPEKLSSHWSQFGGDEPRPAENGRARVLAATEMVFT